VSAGVLRYRMSSSSPANRLNEMIRFVRTIGIEVQERELPGPTILPGLTMENGALIVDRARLAYPGDLLHEAGHLAVKLPAERAVTTHSAGSNPAEEMAAIAWAWAAGQHLQLPPEVVFHQAAYKNGSGAQMAEDFRSGRWFGVPFLQWIGLTAEPRQATALGRAAYPAMTKWLRE
jgi:hypothetical protein